MTCESKTKTAAYLPPLVGLSAYSDGSNIYINWNTNAPLFPDQICVSGLRRTSFATQFTLLVDVERDVGSKTLAGGNLTPDAEYTLWIRPEMDGYYGEWQSLIVVFSDGFEVGFSDVTHLGELVTYLGEQVTSPL